MALCSLRDPYRKRELKLLELAEMEKKGVAAGRGGKGGRGGRGGRGGGAGGKKKSGSAGKSIAEAIKSWKYFNLMSFYKPRIYTRP